MLHRSLDVHECACVCLWLWLCVSVHFIPGCEGMSSSKSSRGLPQVECDSVQRKLTEHYDITPKLYKLRFLECSTVGMNIRICMRGALTKRREVDGLHRRQPSCLELLLPPVPSRLMTVVCLPLVAAYSCSVRIRMQELKVHLIHNTLQMLVLSAVSGGHRT